MDTQGWQQREQVLLSELVAVRKQVDRLLQQQESLLAMLLPSGLPRAQNNAQEDSSITSYSSSAGEEGHIAQVVPVSSRAAKGLPSMQHFQTVWSNF